LIAECGIRVEALHRQDKKGFLPLQDEHRCGRRNVTTDKWKGLWSQNPSR
jgi:hypothetical protein